MWPVAHVSQPLDAPIGHERSWRLGQVRSQEGVALAPDNQHRHLDWAARSGPQGWQAAPKQGAIVVDGRGQRARSAERLDVLGCAELASNSRVVASAQGSFGQPGQLEKEHVPASSELVWFSEVFEEGDRMRRIQ